MNKFLTLIINWFKAVEYVNADKKKRVKTIIARILLVLFLLGFFIYIGYLIGIIFFCFLTFVLIGIWAFENSY